MSKTLELFESIQNHLNESEETNSNIKSVIPNYTGGSIYTYTGKLSDGNYFMAEDSIFDKTNPTFSIRIVNENPDEVGEDSWYPEWQEEHLVRDVVETDNEAKEFTRQILQWIITNKPEGNYDVSDMETMKNVLDNINESEVVENKKLTKDTKNEIESSLIKSYQETDYGYHNNATMIYGELLDGNWYVYIPDNDAFDIYNEPITNKFINTLYNYDDVDAEEDLRDDTWYDNFVKEHKITKNYDSNKINQIISELDHKYYGDDFIEED